MYANLGIDNLFTTVDLLRSDGLVETTSSRNPIVSGSTLGTLVSENLFPGSGDEIWATRSSKSEFAERRRAPTGLYWEGVWLHEI